MSLPFDGFKAAQTGLVDMGNISFYNIGGATPAFNPFELAQYATSFSEIVLNVTWAQLQASQTSLDTFRKTFDTNFFNTVAVTQTLLRLVKKSDDGSINPRSTKWPNIGISSGLFSIGHASPVAELHPAIAFSRSSPAASRALTSSSLILDFFQETAWLGGFVITTVLSLGSGN